MAHDTYCKLTINQHAFSAKCDIVIDLGQQNISTEYADVLKDYISEIDALNYMSMQGWELVNSYANQTLYETRHILKKKATL
ncbi:hypothetical protein JN11_01358 [Mucilaginibacter frigoritolerans]|jgi:hypothetical protein|uniref:Uncharacterized protein n=1 Tax=Mucilaginibacter frigoritolerans TaxID=652788 RepID=A0A562U9A5_9SPHI|nr:hypothetical protein [Mucilaginibacter frigoritolerans]TWJ02386.1 hypothetical protein JN11_01358 [Mucilaginibacter frigoritolerans]